MDKPKILVTASTFPRWENDTIPPFVSELSKGYLKEFEVHILTHYFPHSKKYEILNDLIIHRYKTFPFKKFGHEKAIMPSLRENKLLLLQIPSLFIQQLLHIRKLVKEHNIEKIHAHWIIPQGLIAILYKKLFNRKINILMTCHGADIYELRNKTCLKIKKWILNNASGVTAVSSAIRQEIKDIGLNGHIPIEVISMGVNSILFNKNNYNNNIKSKYNINGPFLLFVGRLSKKKGIEYLLQAMPKIVKYYPHAKLLIIGSGEENGNLKAIMSSLGLNGSVIQIEALPNSELPVYYATADIFIGPSVISESGDSEGLPVTYMEAAASGCAIIGTDLDGNKDIIIDGETGLIVKQKNSDEIAMAVKRLLDDEDYRKKLINNCNRVIKNNFTWENISNKYINIINSCN